MKRREYNRNIFNVMTNETAYWLGVLFSDGCLYSDKYRKTISLSSKDKDFLENFCNFISLDQSYIKRKNQYFQVQLCDMIIYNKLMSYGLEEKKSLTLQPPNIEHKYIKSFILGFFDGDGSISTNKSINQWKVSLGTGSLIFSNWIKDYLKIYNPSLHTRKLKTGKEFYDISLIGIKGKLLMQDLYEFHLPNYCLYRKYSKFLELSKVHRFKNPNYHNWEIEIIKNISDINEIVNIINNDIRNFGFTRSKDCIIKKKKSLTKHNI
jgi:hypothetical protein